MAKKKQNIKPKNAVAKISSPEYTQLFSDIKNRIQQAQIKAAAAANKELTLLYWKIGEIITLQQEKNGWGTNFVERLAKDLQNAFPGIAGFSRSNIFRMKAFFSSYAKNPTAVGQIEP